jgi:dienelactone hydrolase
MDEIVKLLGTFPIKTSLESQTIEFVDCGSYIREKVEYNVEPGERISAYLCVPKNLKSSIPAIFCHHQHAGNFELGKSEVVGLAGDLNQAYASELAEQGFITFAPDAIAFEERNWSDSPGKAEYFELSKRLVRGETLLAKVIHDAIVGLDYLETRPEVDETRIGFIGHSYGGRMALWLPAFDTRLKASVSNCGCVPYRHSLTHDAGIQMEFCIPGIMKEHDIEDVIKEYKNCSLLISATTDDKWSRGAEEVYVAVRDSLLDVELLLYEGKHVFTENMRANAYGFLKDRLYKLPST